MRIQMNLAVAVAAVAVAFAGAASAQTVIEVGQTVEGALTADDPVMAVDGSNYDCYVFSTVVGRTYLVDLESDAFDAFIGLRAGGTCQPPVETYNNDRAEGETDARLAFTATSGEYFVFANSLEAGQSGPYRLRVRELDD